MDDLKNMVIDPKRLMAARGDLSLTRAAQAVGISKQRLWNYENGLYQPPSDVVARLCVLYQVSILALTNQSEKILDEVYIRA